MLETRPPESTRTIAHKAMLYTLHCMLCCFGFYTSAVAQTYDVDASTGFRMERYRAPVPSSIPGGITVDTEFVKQKHSEGNMLFIDVFPPRGMGADPIDGFWVVTEPRFSISGTVWLPEVGRGYLDPPYADYFKRNLLRLTKAQYDKPMVFFCTADCWQSWNAAKRAIELGYTQVHWYPNGTDGWQEHGLAVVETAPVNFIDDTTPQLFPATASVSLVTLDGEETTIGSISFTNKPDGSAAFSLDISGSAFSDHFLSMRPFKCLTEHKDWYCYLPYPYKIGNSVTATDLSNLEYQLLFIKKSESEFGIDAWNGLYYKLNTEPNGVIAGELLQGDLNVLQSPPEENTRPIDLAEFFDDDSKKQRFPKLLIRP